jgi:type IV pilus assembly protein PilQ
MTELTRNRGTGPARWLGRVLGLGAIVALGMSAAMAQAPAQNAIESITANQQGSNVIVTIMMKEAPAAPPLGFAITSPARIALDFGATRNATGKNMVDLNLGDLRSANVVQTEERSRLVLNLKRARNYATVVDGKAVVVTIEGSGGVAQAVGMTGLPVAAPAPAPAPEAAGPRQALRDLDFRRGPNGEGRVVVDLPNNQIAVDVRPMGTSVVVDFMKTSLPPTLRRRLDASDFGTPVTMITTAPQGENVRMTIEAQGLWEQSVYQSDTQLVIDIKPIKEDPNKLTQGTQGYRGEKITFDFQNIDVRACLRSIADISGLNIITSESVSGNLTLRLKDVPWDQALDAILNAKNLDMRKNGTVVWIAPREELLTKERLELEQRTQISELEPLRSEVFQLNYQKAEAFKTVFALDSGDSKKSLLSKRGNAVIDARTNQLFVTDIGSKLDVIRQLILKTDIPSKQVLIEARIVEADDTFGRNLGAKLGFAELRNLRGGDAGYQVNGNTRVAVGGNYVGVGQVTGQTPDKGDAWTNSTMVNLPAAGIGGAAAGSLAVSLFSAAANRFLNLEVSALEADGKGKIISSPRVVVADKVPAIIEQGVDIPYQSAVTTSGGTSTTISFRKANLKLEVTPQITPDGNIVLDVDVTKDSVGEAVSAGLAINNKHVKSTVMVENGGTVVLGGIYTQEERHSVTKVPLLGDLPLIGNLFKSNSRTDNKTELLIFITPKIQADRMSAAR